MHPLAKWGPVVVLCSVGVGAVLRATYEEDKIKEKHFEEALFQVMLEEERKKAQAKND